MNPHHGVLQWWLYQKLHICVDMKTSNENVLPEVHSPPKADTTLAQPKSATVISKLAADATTTANYS